MQIVFNGQQLEIVGEMAGCDRKCSRCPCRATPEELVARINVTAYETIVNDRDLHESQIDMVVKDSVITRTYKKHGVSLVTELCATIRRMLARLYMDEKPVEVFEGGGQKNGQSFTYAST